jgi:hypothetical protein
MVVLVAAIVACGKSADPQTDDAGSAYSNYNGVYDGAEYDLAVARAPMATPEPAYFSSDIRQTSAQSTATSALIPSTDKIVYSGNATIETTAFDDTIERFEELVKSLGGFVEFSYVSGKPIIPEVKGTDGVYRPMYTAYRSATFTVRIPAVAFEGAKSTLGTLGNVTSLTSSAVNITAQYTDNEARLVMYRTEETRLNILLERADTIADIMSIESRLAQVQYEIESLETSKRNMDSQVSYSTLSVNIAEVEKYTETEQPHRTYWQQIGDALRDSIKAIGRFFAWLGKAIVAILPVLLIIAVVVLILVALVKSRRKRKAKKYADKEQ